MSYVQLTDENDEQLKKDQKINKKSINNSGIYNSTIMDEEITKK